MKLTLERAISIAAEAHAGQRDKAGAPYILHPLRVMLAQSTDQARIVAVLHDVLEDCADWSADRLRGEGCDEAGLDALDALSRRPGETYPAFIERCSRNELARIVKLADLRDNQDPNRFPDSSMIDRERMERYADAETALVANRITAADGQP